MCACVCVCVPLFSSLSQGVEKLLGKADVEFIILMTYYVHAGSRFHHIATRISRVSGSHVTSSIVLLMLLMLLF